MTTGFNDSNNSDSDDNPLELMSYISSRSEAKEKDRIEVVKEVEEYDPRRVTPTADYMIDVFASNDADGSKQPPQITALNSSQKTPTAQQAGNVETSNRSGIYVERNGRTGRYNGINSATRPSIKTRRPIEQLYRPKLRIRTRPELGNYPRVKTEPVSIPAPNI
ncbi:UNVERIFIED_CONTAM: hypothetical protein HDU68_009548 [Siphonaria sp. JEL0065]|nr:hypothetical protein HDU68_009548 [Siphonaria sp. JEL0065]